MDNDEIVWWSTNDEIYSVKGGILVCFENEIDCAKEIEGSWSAWNLIWKSQMQGWVINYAWRRCHKCGPM